MKFQKIGGRLDRLAAVGVAHLTSMELRDCSEHRGMATKREQMRRDKLPSVSSHHQQTATIKRFSICTRASSGNPLSLFIIFQIVLAFPSSTWENRR